MIATVLADSAFKGSRLTTMVVKIPRMLLSEFNTHRAFSRNSASSRAIPFVKRSSDLKKGLNSTTHSVDPNYWKTEHDAFIPWHWPKANKGMQGILKPVYEHQSECANYWVALGKEAVSKAAVFASEPYNLHKSIPNRLLEPFLWQTVLVTGNEAAYKSFFELRGAPTVNLQGGGPAVPIRDIFASRPKDVAISSYEYGEAEPHFTDCAMEMLSAYLRSVPVDLTAVDYSMHAPFIDFEKDIERIKEAYRRINPEVQLGHFIGFISAARCARVSYDNVDGTSSTPEADFELSSRLVKNRHYSPLEHFAFADRSATDRLARNYKTHWAQLRAYYD